MRPLTKETIEMTRTGLLDSEWCGFSKRDTVNRLCDLALKGLSAPYAEGMLVCRLPVGRSDEQTRTLVDLINRAQSSTKRDYRNCVAPPCQNTDGCTVVGCRSERYAPSATARPVVLYQAPSGFKLLPKEPISEVLDAIIKYMTWPDDCTPDAVDLYRVIYEAAHIAEGSVQPEEGKPE